MSFIHTIKQGDVLLKITEQNLSPSDITALSHTSKATYHLITQTDRAKQIWAPFIPRDPFSYYPVTIIFTRGEGQYQSYDLQLVSLDERTVMRLQQFDYKNQPANIVFLTELKAWLHLLLNGRFNRDQELVLDEPQIYRCRDLLDAIMSYDPEEISSKAYVIIEGLRELCDLIGFDALKSFLSINFKLNNLQHIKICTSQFKKSMHLNAVRQDPVGALTFFYRIATLFLKQRYQTIELNQISEAAQKIISLPNFSFTLFNRFFLQNVSLESAATGIKCLSNCQQLISKGHLTFKMIAKIIRINANSKLNIVHLTNALCDAVEQGFISLNQHNHLFYDDHSLHQYNILKFLKEETEVHRKINRVYQELQSLLSARPDYKEKRQYWEKMLSIITPGLIDKHYEFFDNNFVHIDLTHDPAIPKGPLTGKSLFNLMIGIYETQEQAFDRFIKTQSEMLQQEPLLFSYYLMRSVDQLKKLSHAPQELSLDDVKKDPDAFIRKTFSRNGIIALNKLSNANLQALLRQMIENSFLSEIEPGLISFHAATFADFKRKNASPSEIEALFSNFIKCFEAIRPLLNDPHHPIRLNLFTASLDIADITLDTKRAIAMAEKFMRIPLTSLQDNIAFLRQSLLKILQRHFGSAAASPYFMELSNDENHTLLRSLFLLSLNVISRDEWNSSVEHFITFIFQLYKVQKENGEITTSYRGFAEFFHSFINATMESALAGEKPDVNAIISKIKNPDYDSDDSSSSESESESEDEDEMFNINSCVSSPCLSWTIPFIGLCAIMGLNILSL